MKPLNNIERKTYRLKFIAMYSISIGLILVILSAFLQPVPALKTVMVEKEKPARVITKTVYVQQKNATKNSVAEYDSLVIAINNNQKQVDELNAYIDSQKNIITALQNQSVTTNIPDNISSKNEVAKLKKKIEFYDWALRSQIAVTNTLTRENKKLKAKIDGPGKNN